MDAYELADLLGDEVNTGVNPDSFAEGVQQQHNALQRYIFDQVLKPGIVGLASVPYVDARNERVVEEAQAVCDCMGWDY